MYELCCTLGDGIAISKHSWLCYDSKTNLKQSSTCEHSEFYLQLGSQSIGGELNVFIKSLQTGMSQSFTYCEQQTNMYHESNGIPLKTISG